MKKLIVFAATTFICLASSFAQKIPEDRDILPVVLEFASEKESWTEGELLVADITNNEYVITGNVVSKAAVGYQNRTYTVSISRTDTELLVSVSDMSTIECDKDGVALKTAIRKVSTKKQTDKQASIITKDLSKRLTYWGDEEYSEKLAKALTSPVILSNISKQSALVFNKFVTDNRIVGKATEFQMDVVSVDSNTIVGQAFCGYKTGTGGIPKPEYVTVTVISKNPSAVAGETYNVKGTIKDVQRGAKGGLASLQIAE